MGVQRHIFGPCIPVAKVSKGGIALGGLGINPPGVFPGGGAALGGIGIGYNPLARGGGAALGGIGINPDLLIPYGGVALGGAGINPGLMFPFGGMALGGAGIDPVTPPVAPTAVQHNTANNGGAGGFSLAWDAPTANHNFLVAVVKSDSIIAAGDIPAGADSNGSVWQEACQAFADPFGLFTVSIMWKANAASESTSPTFCAANGNNVFLAIMEFTGSQNTLDVVANDNDRTTNPVLTGTTASTAQAIELVIAAMADGWGGGEGGFPADNPQGEPFVWVDFTSAGHAYYCITAVTGPQSTSHTITSPGFGVCGCIAAFMTT